MSTPGRVSSCTCEDNVALLRDGHRGDCPSLDGLGRVLTPEQVVDGVLDDALDTEYGYEDGEPYTYLKSGTAERIVAALREAGLLTAPARLPSRPSTDSAP